MSPFLGFCYPVSTQSHTPPQDTRFAHVEIAHPAVVECRFSPFRFCRPSRALGVVYFRTSRWISMLQT